MNDENLKNGQATQFRSGEEAAREAGRKGGIASGQARSFKSLIRKKLDEGDNWDKLVDAIYNEGLYGNAQAWAFLRDTIGEKPKDTLEIDSDSVIRVTLDD